MAYILTAANVKQRLYEETIDEISREDADTVTAAIQAAIDEAKGYMNRYDIDKILGTPSADATVTDGNLLAKLKDLFVWHFIALSNATIEYGPAESRYMIAIEKYFEKVQKGIITPAGWPFIDPATLPEQPDGDSIQFSSNTKRNNHF